MPYICSMEVLEEFKIQVLYRKVKVYHIKSNNGMEFFTGECIYSKFPSRIIDIEASTLEDFKRQMRSAIDKLNKYLAESEPGRAPAVNIEQHLNGCGNES